MKQPIQAITGAFALLSLTGALGCGDDGSSGSGVDRSKLVSEVTDADAKKVCQWLAKESASIQPSKKQLCTAGAIGISNTEAACNEFVTACVQSDDTTPPEEETSDCSDASADDVDTSCTTITVGDYEACARAMLNGLKGQLSSLSCADAGEDIQFGSTTPAACKKIEDECPDLLDSLGGDGVDTGTGTGTGTGSSSLFACGDGSSVPQDYVCDDFEDCDNGKDELSCP